MKKKFTSNHRKFQSFVPRPCTPPSESSSTYLMQREMLCGLAEKQKDYCNTIQMFAQMRGNMALPFHNFNKDKAGPEQPSSLNLPTPSFSKAGALTSSAQQQRLLQNSSNAAPFFFQSMKSNYERYAAMNWLRQLAHPTSSSNNGFHENLMDFK